MKSLLTLSAILAFPPPGRAISVLLAAEGGQGTDAGGLPDIDEVREYNTDPHLSDRDPPNPESRPSGRP